ncbi:MAG: DUF1566 domain-containing protein [Magnetococcales bacterium]|nr:DUF1566 domain-containing protein [Magnetococcales bacterium]
MFRKEAFVLLLIVLSGISVSACNVGEGGGGGSSNSSSTLSAGTLTTGQFVDSPVQGLAYATPTQSGMTDSKGTFQYKVGETVTFKVGDVVLGSATGSATVTPITLGGVGSTSTTPSVANVASFLQSLDQSAGKGSSIVIPQSAHTALTTASNTGLVTNLNADFAQGTASTSFTSNLSNAVAVVPGATVVSTATAQATMVKYLTANNIPTIATADSTSNNLILGINSVTVAEPVAGGTASASFTITLGAASTSAVTVSVATTDGTAKSGTNYTATSQTITFNAGETSKTLAVPVIGDGVYAADKAFNVTLSTPTGGAALSTSATVGVGTIKNSDAAPSVQFAAATQTSYVGDTITATVTLSKTSGLVTTVPYTVSGTAVSGTDYSGLAASPLIIPAGSQTGALTFKALSGSGKTVILTLGTPTNASTGTINTLTSILSNQVISISSATVGENVAGVTGVNGGVPSATFTLTMSPQSSQSVSVSVATSDATAKGGTNYTPASGTVTFAPGETSKIFYVPILADGKFTANQTFNVTLSNATGGAALSTTAAVGVGTVNNIDPEPTVSFSTSTLSKYSTNKVTITVSLSKVNGMDTSIPFTATGTAVAGTDYTGLTASPLVIPAGTLSGTVSFTATKGGGKTVILTMGSPTYATAGTTSVVTITLNDNNVVALPRTGQTLCYDAAGASISCAGTGQDGAILKGVAWPSPRFTDNGDGTVLDNLTGVVWLKNANCFGLQTWSTAFSNSANLVNGTCGLTDGSKLRDWRLPNIAELESLLDDSQTSGLLLSSGHPFTNVQSGIYWSSSSYVTGIRDAGGNAISAGAWVIDPSIGDVYYTTYGDTKVYAWPVRGGQ